MAETGLDTKTARHDAILELVSAGPVTSQGQLRELLSERGFETAQATLSRDLAELQAVKVKTSSGASVYSVPDVNGVHTGSTLEGNARLARWCQDLLVSAQEAQNLLVLRTLSGAANLLGSAVDTSRLPGVLGTIAGDDTILLICDDDERARQTRDLLTKLAERGSSSSRNSGRKPSSSMSWSPKSTYLISSS